MKKIIKAIALLLVAVLISVGFTACDLSCMFGGSENKEEKNNESNTSEQTEIYTLSGSAITGLTSYGKTLTDFVIPEKINGVTIKSIDEYAFGQTKLKSIVFDDNSKIEEIGYCAFRLTFLTQITLPSTVEKIDEWAFWGCKSLQTITLNEGLKTIGKAAFSGCLSMKAIVLPASLTNLGKGAFSGCDAMESITFVDTKGWSRIQTSQFENDKYFDYDATSPTDNAYNLIKEEFTYQQCELRKK